MEMCIRDRGDIEEGVWAAGIVFGDVGGVESRPPVPDFLHVSFVGNGAGGRFSGPLGRSGKARQCKSE